MAENKTKKDGATIRVVRTGSLIGAGAAQKKTMEGLGLRKIGMSREYTDGPAIRGMIRKVAHLVRVES